MNWDQPIHSLSYSNGEPPTPIKTPTSATFGHTALQTPKVESSFYDPRVTWNTADPYAASPELLRTPLASDIEDLSKSAFYTSDQKRLSGHDLDAELASHVHHLSPNPRLPLPPVEPTRQLSSSPNPCSSNRTCLDGSEFLGPPRVNTDLSGSDSRSAVSMQTPPPTSTSRRKTQNFYPGDAGHASMASSRRMSTPNVSKQNHAEMPSHIVEASPQIFPNLPFSPDLFRHPMPGPATAPIYPQHKLFWDPHTAPPSGNMDMSTSYMDPFGPNSGSNTHGFLSSPASSHAFQVPQHPMMQVNYEMHDPHRNSGMIAVSTSPAVDDAVFPAPFTVSPRVSTVSAEDPSMYLSSPARRFGPTPQPTGSFNFDDQKTRQPYHHQTQESEREKEFERAKKPKRRAPDSMSTKEEVRKRTPPIPEVRPGIKRSVTHTGITNRHSHNRRQSHVSFADSVAYTNGDVKPTSHGRSSPLKSQNQNTQFMSSDLGQPRTRTSLTFTIDENGRAKTETRIIVDPPASAMDANSRMDLDDISSQSDSDSLDHADFQIASSRNTSFIFPEQDQYKPNFGLLKSESGCHSKSSSYSSTLASSNSAYQPSRSGSVRSNSRRGQKLSQHNAWSRPPTRRSRDQDLVEPSSEAETVLDPDEAMGDAQYALKQVLKERLNRHSSGFVSGPYNMPTAQVMMHSSPPEYGVHYDPQQSNINISPTTITDPDLATPSTDRESHISGGTRCVCNSVDSGGHLMIQCESCSKWLHTQCVGLDSRTLPPVYVCAYCIQTPMRGGRLREPTRTAGQVPTSPLAHKSHRFR